MFKRFTNGLRACCEPLAAGPIPVRRHPDLRGLCGRHDRHSAWGPSRCWPATGAIPDGFWGLLAFSMQMALVLVLGSAMASAKPCKTVLRKRRLRLCHKNMQRHRHHHLGLHRLLLAQLGLRPGRPALCWPRRWPSGVRHRGLSLADRLRLLRLRHLARRPLRLHSPARWSPGGTEVLVRSPIGRHHRDHLPPHEPASWCAVILLADALRQLRHASRPGAYHHHRSHPSWWRTRIRPTRSRHPR